MDRLIGDDTACVLTWDEIDDERERNNSHDVTSKSESGFEKERES
jgi:hypothetical protein